MDENTPLKTTSISINNSIDNKNKKNVDNNNKSSLMHKLFRYVSIDKNVQNNSNLNNSNNDDDVEINQKDINNNNNDKNNEKMNNKDEKNKKKLTVDTKNDDDDDMHIDFNFKLILSMSLLLFFAVGNTVSFKRMLNQYRSQDKDYPHNYEFFVNQFNVSLYVMLASTVVLSKRCGKNGKRWANQQKLSAKTFFVMGFLDAFAAFLTTIGGAYTAGSVQILLNQCVIPLTLIMSYIFLENRFNRYQITGAILILFGAFIAVIPSITGNNSQTTVIGATIFFFSVVPGAFSNVYKESSFKSAAGTDVYFLTTCVSTFQVLSGFLFMPLLAVPGMGGISLSEIPQQLTDGFQCFLGNNPEYGDDCHLAMEAMFTYVLINFFYNVIQLLITKHGSAALLVITASLSLPVTNIAFSQKWLMGKDAEPFSIYDLMALIVVISGFIIYSVLGYYAAKRAGAKTLPLQGAAGSMIYVRPRSNSDPSTPGYTPVYYSTPGSKASSRKIYGKYGKSINTQYYHQLDPDAIPISSPLKNPLTSINEHEHEYYNKKLSTSY